jgi:hypothetical protein
MTGTGEVVMSPILFRHFDGAVCGPAGTNEPVQNQVFSERTRCDSCILIALGVLAMTVGLIRSETAGDLRTLTAAAAGWLLGGRAPSAVSRQPLE